jgi:hypothetical protein
VEEPVETTYSLAAAAPKQPDRRESDRYLSLLRVGSIIIEGQRELCLIRNISAGGMMIRAYSPISVGTRVTIELKQGDPVSGLAKWVDGELTGITFDEPIDVLLLLAPPGDGPRPRLPRIEVECTAWVREDGDVIRTLVHNISQGGLRINSRSQLTVGADVVVTLPGLTPAAGVVKWRNGGDSYGIAFNRSLVLSELVEWPSRRSQSRRCACSA